MSTRTTNEIGRDQKDAQAAARAAILEAIAKKTPNAAVPHLRDLAEAYALVVAPDRGATSATARSDD